MLHQPFASAFCHLLPPFFSRRLPLSPSEIITIIARYLQQHAADVIECILLELDTQCHYSVPIDLQLLADCANPAFVAMVLCAPMRMLPLANEACLLVQQQLLKCSSSSTLMAFKPHVHARLKHLPRMFKSFIQCISVTFCSGTPEIIRETVSSILSRDVGHVVQVPGTVVRTGMLKMLEQSRRYRCGKCGQEKEVAIDMELRNATLCAPTFCTAAAAETGGVCGGKSFSKVEGSEVCQDYQEIKIQEQVQHLGMGSMPRAILVLLHDDLVDSCKPGDDVRRALPSLHFCNMQRRCASLAFPCVGGSLS